MAKSQFLEHIPCPECGSSDAGGLYDDGTAKCHKCGHRWTAEEPDPLEGSAEVVAQPGELLDGRPVRLPARGISRETCELWGYWWNKDRGVQIANYCPPDSKTPVAQKIRRPDKSFGWVGDRSRIGLYGEHLWRDGGKMVIVTEGEIDALSVSQVQGNRWPVVSVPDGAHSAAAAVTKSLAWLEGFERVVFMFDEDEPGREAAEECARLVSPGKGYIARLPLKDPNELLQAGRGDEIRDAACSAWVISETPIWISN